MASNHSDSSKLPHSAFWRRLFGPLLFLAAVVALLALGLPHLLSAYHLEAGGRALDQPATALRHLQQAINWVPANAQAYRLLAKVYRTRGDLPAAVEAMQRFIQTNPKNPLGHIELAQLYEAAETAGLPQIAGHTPAAESALEWRRAGLSAANLLAWGEQARIAKQYPDAELWYRRAARLAPDLGDPRYSLGLLYEEQEQWPQALEAYQQASAAPRLDQVGRSTAYFHAGLIYRWHLDPAQPEQALAAYQAAVSLDDFSSDSDAAQGHYLLGYALREAGRDPQAYLPQFRSAVGLNPRHGWAHLLLGLTLYEANQDLPAAEAELRQAIQLDPTNRWAYYHLAELYRQAGLTDQARATYEQALQLAPDFTAARQRLQDLDKESGDNGN